MNELHMFPNKIVLIEIGQVISLSKFLLIVSQGNTIGPIEVEVKKTTIPISPDNKYIGFITLPRVKAIKRIIGKIRPCIITGGLL